MPPRRISRRYAIAASSLVVHAVALAIVWFQTARLPPPPSESGPPEPIIPILIMPRVPPAAASDGSRPTTIRLHRRPQRFVTDDTPVAPLIAPETVETPRPPPPSGPATVSRPTQEETVAAGARTALRGRLGCANAAALGLSRAEREACDNALAAGAPQADFPGLGIDAGKAKGLDAAAAQRERDYKYFRSTGAPGTTGAGPSATANAPGRGINLPGATAEGIGATVGSDRPTYKVPF